MKTIFLILLSTFPFFTFCQNKKFYNGLGFEVGAGYNTLLWKVDPVNLTEGSRSNRDQLWLNTCLRISYKVYSRKLNESLELVLIPFVGFYTFGGKSKKEPNGYQDYYAFKSIEGGFLPTLNIKDKVQVSAGIKGQYVLNARTKFNGSFNQPYIDGKTCTIREVDLFKDFAENAGFRVRYKIKFFTVGAEGWFGLTNLIDNRFKNPHMEINIRDNNYRLLFGVEL